MTHSLSRCINKSLLDTLIALYIFFFKRENHFIVFFIYIFQIILFFL